MKLRFFLSVTSICVVRVLFIKRLTLQLIVKPVGLRSRFLFTTYHLTYHFIEVFVHAAEHSGSTVPEE